MKLDLTDEETDALARLLRDTTDADHYPLSPRVQIWKGILAKIRPEPSKASLTRKGLEPKPEPLPLLKRYEPPRAGDIGDGEGQLFWPAEPARQWNLAVFA